MIGQLHVGEILESGSLYVNVPDNDFHGEENEVDVDMVCAIKTIDSQLNLTDPGVQAKETSRDPVIAPPQTETQDQAGMVDFRKISSSLSTDHGCLLHGSRVVIPWSLQFPVLNITNIITLYMDL